MAAIQTVVLPLDGSRLSEAAIPYALLLARLMSADLVVLRVLETMRPIYDNERREVIWVDPAHPRGEFLSPEILQPVVARLVEQGIEPHPVVRIGDPREEIIHEADQHPGAAIVLASHGRGGLKRALLGSVASRVLQAASYPVLIVRADETPREPQRALQRITLLLDGSSLAEQALPIAVDLTRAADAELRLIRVAETYRDELPREGESLFVTPSYQGMLAEFDRMESDARSYLEEQAARLRSDQLRVSWQVLSGDPWRQLLAYTEQNDPDLVVLTTHGWGGLKRWFYGSVADRLLTASDVPLLLIRAQPPQPS